MKYFRIERIQQAIEHLEQFHSKWVVVPLVFAVNGVNEKKEVNLVAQGQAGAEKFLQQYFDGSLIGLPPFDQGKNTLRPRFQELLSTLKSEGKESDYIIHQKQGLWANAYSSRGYREMVSSGIVTRSRNSQFQLTPKFSESWEENLPSTFHFEELLIWLYAFNGIPDKINTWQDLFINFQEKHLGKNNRFPDPYKVRFNVDNNVEWENNFLTDRPTDIAFQQNLIPSIFAESKIPIGYLAAEIKDDNEIFIRVKQLLSDGFAGVILTGPPGTSKSWYASQIGIRLVDGDPHRIRFIQFHSSYQYEDFVEGFVPQESGGFKLVPKHLLEMCNVAQEVGDKYCVLVIDELSRTDPARVFGEALTYIEISKRERKFHLSSGREISIPTNLIFITTMNPIDKGVDEVDAALERRFAKIAMNPSGEQLQQFLENKGMDDQLRNRVVSFFNHINSNKNQLPKIGHAYFYGVSDEDGLKRLWQNQLSFYFEKALRLDPESFQEIERRWNKIFVAKPADSSDEVNSNPENN